MSVEARRKPRGLSATLSQREGDGKLIGLPSVRLVASAAEAKRQAQMLAPSLGLKVYGLTLALTQRNPPPVPKSRQKPADTRFKAVVGPAHPRLLAVSRDALAGLAKNCSRLGLALDAALVSDDPRFCSRHRLKAADGGRTGL